MAELGGPRNPAEVAEVHRRRLDGIERGEWWLKVVPDPGGPAAGSIGIWDSEWHGEEIHEAGWMILPEHQGKGLAKRALARLIEMARGSRRYGRIHAFPGVTNAPSNALCRGAGFEHLGEDEVEFAGRPLRVNHWALDVSGGGEQPEPPR